MELIYGQIRSVDDKTLKDIRQLGVKDVHFNLPFDLKADKKWEYEDLLDFKNRCDAYGVTIKGMENMPISFYDKAMLGEDGKEEQIKNVCESIENLGKVGIKILGFHFSPSFVWRTENYAPLGRYGAKVQAFDLDKSNRGIDDMADFGQRKDVLIDDVEILWKNFQYFMERVIPTCEKAGVTLCIHPDDPPIKSLSGIARMFIDIESYKRAFDMIKSDNFGMLFCIGTFSQMEGGAKNVFEAIECFAPKNKIIYAHMRDVKGTVPNFHECFLSEGNFSPIEVIEKLYEYKYNGFIIVDHVPLIEDDTPWGHRARFYETGYLKGLIEAVSKYK